MKSFKKKLAYMFPILFQIYISYVLHDLNVIFIFSVRFNCKKTGFLWGKRYVFLISTWKCFRLQFDIATYWGVYRSHRQCDVTYHQPWYNIKSKIAIIRDQCFISYENPTYQNFVNLYRLFSPCFFKINYEIWIKKINDSY